MATARRLWRLVDPGVLVHRRWDDDHVIYNCASGDTHLLNAVAAQVLHHLADTPADAVTLGGRIAAALEEPPDPSFSIEIERLLERLDALGLVEPVWP